MTLPHMILCTGVVSLNTYSVLSPLCIALLSLILASVWTCMQHSTHTHHKT